MRPSTSARRVGAWVTAKASKPTRRMKGMRSDSTLPTARSSPLYPCFSRSSRAVEKARPSLNLGKLSAIRAKRGRSAAMSSMLSPASMRSPSGALRWASCPRSASQRFLERITGPSGSAASASALTQVSCRKAPSRQTTPAGSRSLGVAGATTALGSSSRSSMAIRLSSTSSGGIERLLEGRGAEATVGCEEGLLCTRAQLEIGVDDLLDRIDDAVGAEAGAGDGGQRRILGTGAAEQQLVVLLPPLLHAQNADVADVVVAAGVDAAGDLDLEVADRVLAGGQALGDALRDGDRAGVGQRAVVETGTGDDVGDEPGVGLG